MPIGQTALSIKLARASLAVGKRYAEQAKREAEADLTRILLSFALLGLGVIFGVHGVAFLHAFAVAALVALGLEPWWVLGGMLVFDWLTAVGLMSVAWFGLSRPILPQTRKRVKELVDFLKA